MENNDKSMTDNGLNETQLLFQHFRRQEGCLLFVNAHIWDPDEWLWDRQFVDPAEVRRIPGQEFIFPALINKKMTNIRIITTLSLWSPCWKVLRFLSRFGWWPSETSHPADKHKLWSWQTSLLLLNMNFQKKLLTWPTLTSDLKP